MVLGKDRAKIYSYKKSRYSLKNSGFQDCGICERLCI